MSVETVHAGALEQEQVLRSEWGGGRSPLRIADQKLGMWLFLFSDALTFGTLLVGYGLTRVNLPHWPDTTEVFNMGLIALMTFILICSSATMAAAVGAAKAGNAKAAVRWLLATIAGGLFFLGSQAYEWTHLIHEGGRLFTNPWGVPQFTSSFFMITGFHGFHVLTGVAYLSVVAWNALRGRYSGLGVEVAGLYWHFVDLVWVFIFTLFYLI